jgi:hypothetical protein
MVMYANGTSKTDMSWSSGSANYSARLTENAVFDGRPRWR